MFPGLAVFDHSQYVKQGWEEGGEGEGGRGLGVFIT